jgi:hypothetical protein
MIHLVTFLIILTKLIYSKNPWIVHGGRVCILDLQWCGWRPCWSFFNKRILLTFEFGTNMAAMPLSSNSQGIDCKSRINLALSIPHHMYLTIPHYIIPYNAVPHHSNTYHTIYHTWHDMGYGMVWPYHTILTHTHTIPYHIIYHIPYHTISSHIPYRTIPYDTVPHHVISFHTIPYHTI